MAVTGIRGRLTRDSTVAGHRKLSARLWVGIGAGLVVWRATRLPCAVSAGAKIFRNLSKLVSTKLNPNGSAATTAKNIAIEFEI